MADSAEIIHKSSQFQNVIYIMWGGQEQLTKLNMKRK